MPLEPGHDVGGAPALVGPRPVARRWLAHGLGLGLTLLTTTYVGGWHHAGFLADLGHRRDALSPADLAFWGAGLWFSLAVLAILGAHEAGHYVACRRYGVDASLPVFLPAPLPITGTFGAFIRIRGAIPHRRALFDIGAAGPFAGFVVALPLLCLGLWLSRPASMPGPVDAVVLGKPLVYRGLEAIVWGALPDGQRLALHPVLRAAWFGLLATALNLFPLAQLDGGHVAYAVFGTRARWITIGTAASVLALTYVSGSWVAWGVLVAIVLVTAGVSHPPTADDHLPLGRGRAWLALVAAAVFALCFTTVPVEPRAWTPPPIAPAPLRGAP